MENSTEKKELTLGEKRVRTEFNPSLGFISSQTLISFAEFSLMKLNQEKEKKLNLKS